MKKISFEIIGHIMILRTEKPEDQILAFASSELKKRKNVKTIMLQTSKVNGDRRTRDLKYLIGEKNFETIHREYGNKFLLNPMKTFFSSRLSYERQRIAYLTKDGDTVLNFFSGVGPFSIAIAKKKPKCRVHSIELNPNAYKYLLKNIKINKCEDRVFPYLGDAFSIVPTLSDLVINRVLLPLPLKSKEALLLAYKKINHEGTIHLQISDHVKAKSELTSVVIEKIKEILNFSSKEAQISVKEIRLIRWLSPRIGHIAVDLSFS
jgi:tRNA (guanine37-N1)-methyltransferase